LFELCNMEALMCASCERVQPPKAYSKSQIKKNAARKCMECASGNVGPVSSWSPADQQSTFLEPCWGCGVEQTDEKRFKQCPLCAAEQVRSGYFCGKECLVKNWKRHKLWREKMAEIKLLTGENPHTIIEEEREITRKELVARHCREAERGAPKDCPEYDEVLARGARALNAGRHPEAKRAFEAAIALDPERGEAHYNMGTLYTQKFEYPPATRHYLDAMECMQRGTQLWGLSATSAYTTINSASCKNMSRPKWMRSSEMMLETALLASEACPDDAKALGMIGDAMMREGRCEDAAPYYRQAAYFADTEQERIVYAAKARGHVTEQSETPSKRGKAKQKGR
jgi:tetratricopeptide (TPR) repeat protein